MEVQLIEVEVGAAASAAARWSKLQSEPFQREEGNSKAEMGGWNSQSEQSDKDVGEPFPWSVHLAALIVLNRK